MKSTLRTISLFVAAGFALAALVQFAGLFSFPGVPTAALFGGSVVCVTLVFVLGDYAQKPAFRVRRSVDVPVDADATVNRPAGSSPDWTYTTRNK